MLRQVIAWRQDGMGVRDARWRLGRGAERDADEGGGR